MAASHYYLIPIFAETESSKGLAHMISEVENVRKYLNPMLRFLGCVITRYDIKNSTHVKFEKLLRNASKEGKFNVFETTIPSSNSVAAASAQQVALVNYKKSLPVSIAYSTLAGELLPHLKGKRRGGKISPVNTEVFGSQGFRADNQDEQIEI